MGNEHARPIAFWLVPGDEVAWVGARHIGHHLIGRSGIDLLDADAELVEVDAALGIDDTPFARRDTPFPGSRQSRAADATATLRDAEMNSVGPKPTSTKVFTPIRGAPEVGSVQATDATCPLNAASSSEMLACCLTVWAAVQFGGAAHM